MTERLVVTVGGVLPIHLGYRLFSVTSDRAGVANMKLGDLVEIGFKQVAPGVFFALFGAWILATSLHESVRLESTHEAFPAASEGAVLERTGAFISELPESTQEEIMSEIGVLQLQSGVSRRRTMIGDQPARRAGEISG